MIYPPIVGATMGDAPSTSINNANTLAFCSIGKRSRTMAIAATPATQLPIACTNRRPISASISPAKKQPTDAMMYTAKPAYKGGLRPKRSNNGPYNSCPPANPIKKLESESATFAVVVFNDRAMLGKPGKYMSIENGDNAVKAPNISTVKKYCFLVMLQIGKCAKRRKDIISVFCTPTLAGKNYTMLYRKYADCYKRI